MLFMATYPKLKFGNIFTIFTLLRVVFCSLRQCLKKHDQDAKSQALEIWWRNMLVFSLKVHILKIPTELFLIKVI